MYSLWLVLVFLMAAGGRGGKHSRPPVSSQVEAPEDVGSEYAPGEESDEESVDWEALTPEVLSKKKGKEKEKEKEKSKEKKPVKGKKKNQEKETEKIREKEKGKEKEKGRGKCTAPVTYTRKKSSGVHDTPEVDPTRRAMYSGKLCIGERAVGVENLIERVPGFKALFENGNLYEICDFPEQTSYCLELVREFYWNAGHLSDTPGSPFVFKTKVRGVELTITPESVASVLDMPVRTDGVDYLQAGLDSVMDWRKVRDALCVPGTDSTGGYVMSKDFKVEYRFLNFVVCYNILPLMNTKIVRWDRLLYMFLLGHPELVRHGNINLNVPFLVWRRMAKDIKTSSQKDRLPYPLIIMRILRLHDVDVRCSSYEYSLGIISETTFVKSSVMLRSPSQRSRRSPPRRSPQRSEQPEAATGEDIPAEDVSISSVCREQRRISGELERISSNVAQLKDEMGIVSRLLRTICDKLGCGSGTLPPAD